MAKKAKPKGKAGRKAKRLKIEGDWKEAVARALRKPKPAADKKDGET